MSIVYKVVCFKMEWNSGTINLHFSEDIVSLHDRVFRDVNRLRNGVRGCIQSPLLKSRCKEGKIRRLWDAFPPRGGLPIGEFIKIVTYSFVSPLIDHFFVAEQVADNVEAEEMIYLRKKILSPLYYNYK